VYFVVSQCGNAKETAKMMLINSGINSYYC